MAPKKGAGSAEGAVVEVEDSPPQAGGALERASSRGCVTATAEDIAEVLRPLVAKRSFVVYDFAKKV